MMRKLMTALLLSTVGYMASCQNMGNSAGTAQVAGGQVKQTIPVDDFEKKMATLAGAQLIDVRTPEEFVGGHLKNAVNIDVRGDAFDAELAKLDKSRPVLVYCLSGGRSSSAAGKMESMGFKTIYNMEGGIINWKGAGKAVETGNAAPRPAGMAMAELNQLVTKKQYVLVDYNAKWCEPCKKLLPTLLALADKKKDKLELLQIDADANESLLKEKGIQAIPYLELYENGKLIWKHNGFIEEAQLLQETKL